MKQFKVIYSPIAKALITIFESQIELLSYKIEGQKTNVSSSFMPHHLNDSIFDELKVWAVLRGDITISPFEANGENTHGIEVTYTCNEQLQWGTYSRNVDIAHLFANC